MDVKLDKTWAVDCNLEVDSQARALPNSFEAEVIDCNFISSSVAPLLAGRQQLVQCTDSYVEAFVPKSEMYVTPPKDETKCDLDPECGNITNVLGAKEGYQMKVERIDFPLGEEMCGADGCGVNDDYKGLSEEDAVSFTMNVFRSLIDARMMKYIFNPVKENLAIADYEISGNGLIQLENAFSNGASDAMLNHNVLSTEWEDVLTGTLTDDALAFGYDNSILPEDIDVSSSVACVDCMDGDSLTRLVGHLATETANKFKLRLGSKDARMMVLVNPSDITATTLMDLAQKGLSCTPALWNVVQDGLQPSEVLDVSPIFDGVEAEFNGYDIGGHLVITSYSIPKGRFLAISEKVRKWITLRQSPFVFNTNEPSGCSLVKHVIVRKAYGYYIPSCYRDKYFIGTLPTEVCCDGCKEDTGTNV